MSVFSNLNSIINEKGAAYVVLVDPDKKNSDSLELIVESANNADVDALFVGGSLMMDSRSSKRVKQIKKTSNIPIIFFPGGVGQLNQYYDAMLFMSVISGRNPHYLIGEQVIAAPIVNDLGLETIPTGYILMDGGSSSTVEVISGTRPIPMDRKDITIAHALAGQYLGMKLIYLEAGSGAKESVRTNIIEAVNKIVDIPIVVGGGIRSPEIASEKVKAGASIVVTGTIIEENLEQMKELSDAVHWKS